MKIKIKDVWTKNQATQFGLGFLSGTINFIRGEYLN